jgi:outer membrane protein X
LTLNPSFTITDNQKVGINLSVFSLLKDLENKNYTERQLIKSVLGTYDYYFAQQNNFAFSIGGGLGIYNINHDLNSLIYYANSGNIINQNDNVFTGSKPGLMLRPGIEFGKFRLGIEFNLIPSYTYKASNSILDETSKNSFFKWNLGIFLGGGHHKSRFN